MTFPVTLDIDDPVLAISFLNALTNCSTLGLLFHPPGKNKSEINFSWSIFVTKKSYGHLYQCVQDSCQNYEKKNSYENYVLITCRFFIKIDKENFVSMYIINNIIVKRCD